MKTKPTPPAHDDLAAARGIVLACALSGAFWVLLLTTIWWLA